MHESTDFGSTENVLRHIKERADDLLEAVIPLTPAVRIEPEETYPGLAMRNVGLILRYLDGSQSLIHKDAAELVLNDGILNRMKVKIRLVGEGP